MADDERPQDEDSDADVLAEGFMPECSLMDGDKPQHGVTHAWLISPETFHSFIDQGVEGARVIQNAMMLLAPDLFPTPSRVKKALRRGRVLLFRTSSPSSLSNSSASPISSPSPLLSASNLQTLGVTSSQWKVLKVGMEVCANDVIGLQDRLGGDYYPAIPHSAPKFKLEVMFEDEHVAVVDKPAGIACYGDKRGGHGRNTVRAALPYCLRPPPPGIPGCFRLPRLTHRIDRDTSGLLLVAKTRLAHSDLSKQFRDRTVKKCYVAVLMGSLPTEPRKGLTLPKKVSKTTHMDMGGYAGGDDEEWGLIDADIEERSAVTHWKVQNSLTVEFRGLPKIELHHVLFRPHTGRKHQLRLHSKDVLQCPILGDKNYDSGTALAEELRNSGMYLHAASLEFPHPGSGKWIQVRSELPPKYSDLWQRGPEARIFRALRGAASKFRTKPCVFFLSNSCNKGANCVYRHDLPGTSSALVLLDSLVVELANLS